MELLLLVILCFTVVVSQRLLSVYLWQVFCNLWKYKWKGQIRNITSTDYCQRAQSVSAPAWVKARSSSPPKGFVRPPEVCFPLRRDHVWDYVVLKIVHLRYSDCFLRVSKIDVRCFHVAVLFFVSLIRIFHQKCVLCRLFMLLMKIWGVWVMKVRLFFRHVIWFGVHLHAFRLSV